MARRSKNSRQKLGASLGDSWDDANDSTDGASTANHSEIELEPSDNELAQEVDVGAEHSGNKEDPLSEPFSKDRMVSGSRSVDYDRTSRTSKPLEPLTRSEQSGPFFIMPKLQDSLPASSGSPSRRPQTRSQNVRNRTPHLRTSDRSSTSYNPTSRAPPTSAPYERQQSPLAFVYENILSPVTRYLVGVFGHTMGNLQPLFGLALAIGVLVFGIQLAIGSARSSLTMALTPVCLIPGSSYVLPFCATTAEDDPRVDFEGLLHAQTGLEDILDAAKDTSTLPSTIKDSELAIRDLRGLVRHSRLPSRHQLGMEFDNFIQTANDASMDLSRFNSRIGATVDRVIATNTWTRVVLTGISEQEASYGALDRIYDTLTRPFVAPPPTLQERIFDQYSLHVSKNAEEITKLIDAGVALHSVLQYLDGLLDTIYQIAINDDASITKDQEELLTQLWTIVGGNKSKLNTNNKKLMLLRNVSAYRKKALTHVSETLLKLREIQAELENLREGVEAPSILGYRNELPISYHLDLIDRGVDRLRAARGESMRVEGETYRNLVGRGKEERRELPAPIVTAKVK